MPIVALPPNTVRAIGSTQVLTDAASVVKELIDNALDARASAIFVEISTNTLDVIQVKDTGHGIGPEDRAVVCRRHCTSKIRALEDLENIGGSSLGFRGEALASAAEMSGSIIVTTRVEGETVAVASRFGRQGERESQERASHPVGTSVRVIDFLKNLPVRRQTALKSPAATFSKIKRTLQAYALARPSIRFSLKVLKAKSDKDNWMYAPKAGACVSDAAIKVVGKEVAGQCQWIVWTNNEPRNLSSSSTPDGAVTGHSSTGNDGYSIEAFLPRPQCELSTISNTGYYISVDSRPVSCTRGVLKQLIGLYKSYLRSTCSPCNGAKLVEPFISLNIICPHASYDANVEPAKDDVLFTNADEFLSTFGNFLRSSYGEIQPEDTSGKASKQMASKPQGFELLLARKPQAVEEPSLTGALASSNTGGLSNGADFPAAVSPENGRVFEVVPTTEASPYGNEVFDSVRHESSDKGTWQRNMYNDDDDGDFDLYDVRDIQPLRTVEDDADDEETLRDVSISNPWTIAKLNAPVRSRLPEPEARARFRSNGQLLTPGRQRGEIPECSIPIFRDDLQDPIMAVPISPTPGRSQRVFSSIPDQTSSSSHPFPFPMKAWRKGDQISTSRQLQKSQGSERYGAGALDTWVQKSLVLRPNSLKGVDNPGDELLIEYDTTSRHKTKDLVPASALSTGTPLRAIPDASQRPSRRPTPRKQQGSINKPFVSPVNDPNRVWFEMERPRGTKAPPAARAQSVREAIAANAPVRCDSEDEDPIIESSPASTARPSPKPMHPDLALTMDYEMRKQAAIQKRKEYLREHAVSAKQTKNAIDILQAPLPLTNSPHENRYNAAVASLSAPDPSANTNATPSVFENSDPRAYLLRVQRREDADRQSGLQISSRKLKRRKTTMLPLETTPVDATVQDLVMVVDTATTSLEGEARKLSACDEYVREGKVAEGLSSLRIEDVRMWEGKLRELVEEGFRTEAGDKSSIEIDLWSAIQDHMGISTAAAA